MTGGGVFARRRRGRAAPVVLEADRGRDVGGAGNLRTVERARGRRDDAVVKPGGVRERQTQARVLAAGDVHTQGPVEMAQRAEVGDQRVGHGVPFGGAEIVTCLDHPTAPARSRPATARQPRLPFAPRHLDLPAGSDVRDVLGGHVGIEEIGVADHPRERT